MIPLSSLPKRMIHIKPLLALCLLLPSLTLAQSAKKNSAPVLVPSINIQSTQHFTPYCLYVLKKSDAYAPEALYAALATALPHYTRVDSLSDEAGVNEYKIEFFSDPKTEVPAPDPEYLSYTGRDLTTKEIQRLQDPYLAVVLLFSGTVEQVIADQLAINQVIGKLVEGKEVLVMDYTTYETFNAASWQAGRVADFTPETLALASQITNHSYRDGRYCRSVTLGMGKFCLPDISLQNYSCSNQAKWATVINLLAQTWLENPMVNVDSSLTLDIRALKPSTFQDFLQANLLNNATQQGTLQLLAVDIQEGDAYNTQFEIVFENPRYRAIQEEQDALLAELFGDEDEIVSVEHDRQLMAASARAKAKLPKLRKQFMEGLDAGMALLLKAPFDTDSGGVEWMWVEVTEWPADGKIKGVLQNDPFEIAGLSSGANVTIAEDEVFDYLLYYGDGTSEGNETGKIMLERQGQ